MSSLTGRNTNGSQWLPFELPLLGSNQDSSDPESDVLPVTPRGSEARDDTDILSPGLPNLAATHDLGNPARVIRDTSLVQQRPQLTPDSPDQTARRAARVATVVYLAVLVAGCREPIVALGGSGPAAEARARAELAFWTLDARVIETARDEKYEAARRKLAQAALLPSRVWSDTGVWTVSAPQRRQLLLRGHFADQQYTLRAARAVEWPSAPADSRHVISLTRLADDQYAWDTEVAYALGDVTANDVGAFTRLLLTAADGRDEDAIRANYRAAVPRMMAALGHLFRVDSIKTVHLPDTSTLATFFLTMSTEHLARRYPDFAQYMQRYVETAKMRWSLTDGAGGQFLFASMHDGRIQFRVRTQHGRLVSIAGPARHVPDSLALAGDFTVKVRLFTVGVRRYHSTFTLTREPHESGFRIVSRQEPDWVLPLITERLLRTPLRRPFQGGGSTFGMAVRDSAGTQTILLRQMHLEVQESAILRFIGRLGFTAFSDFAGRVETQELAWLHEVFGGLVADTHALALEPK